MNDDGKPQNDNAQQDEQAHDLIEQLNLLEAVDRRITPEHIARRFRELLDDIGDDGTATAERLRRVLNQPDRGAQLTGLQLAQLTGLQPRYDAERCVDPVDLIGSMEAAAAAARAAAADIIADAQLKARASTDELRRAQEAVAAARQQAEQIVTGARTEADKALDLAAKVVRDARDQAEQILSEARNEAEQILTAARNQQAHQTAWAGHGGALEVRGGERPVFYLAACRGFDPDQGEGGIALAYERGPQQRGRRESGKASLLAKLLLSAADPKPLLLMVDYLAAASAETDMFSNTAATWVNTVPLVAAMQSAVTADAAAVFSRAVYQALVHNRGIDDAIRSGQIAVTGVGAVGAAALWDLASGAGPRTLVYPTAGAAISLDGRSLVGGADGMVRLRNLRALAEFGEETARTRLAGLLTRHVGLDRLRARADVGDVYAVMQLARLLAERGELDELLHALAEFGYETAPTRPTYLLARHSGRLDTDLIERAAAELGDCVDRDAAAVEVVGACLPCLAQGGEVGVGGLADSGITARQREAADSSRAP